MWMNAGEFSVSMTLLYQNPRRPSEASMTMIVGQPKSATIIDKLEKQGFLVIKITVGEFGKAPSI
jgi:DNA-binding MarR family transcriptional regulator